MTSVLRNVCSITVILLTFLLFFTAVHGVAAQDAKCTANGVEVPCGEIANKIQGFVGIYLVVMGVVVLLGIAATVFWIMMLVHAASHEIPNKPMWVILMVFTQVIGALVYYFAVKRSFKVQATVPLPPTQ